MFWIWLFREIYRWLSLLDLLCQKILHCKNSRYSNILSICIYSHCAQKFTLLPKLVFNPHILGLSNWWYLTQWLRKLTKKILAVSRIRNVLLNIALMMGLIKYFILFNDRGCDILNLIQGNLCYTILVGFSLLFLKRSLQKNY